MARSYISDLPADFTVHLSGTYPGQVLFITDGEGHGVTIAIDPAIARQLRTIEGVTLDDSCNRGDPRMLNGPDDDGIGSTF